MITSNKQGMWSARDAWSMLGAGVLMTFGLPPYARTGILVPLAMALLFWTLVRTKHPARAAWLFGVAHQASCLYWLFLLDPSKSIPTRALVPVQALAAIGYTSLFYLLVGWVHGRVRQRWGMVRALLALPVIWTAMEALRSRGELGFPWCLSGSAVIGGPLLAVVRTSGEIGAGAGFAFVAACVAGVWHWRWRLGPHAISGRALALLGAATAVIWLSLLVGAVVEPSPPDVHTFWADSLGDSPAQVSVAAVQANVALADKWQPARLDSTLIPYRELTRRAAADGAELIVWAETAVPGYLRYDPKLLSWLHETVAVSGAWLLAGFPDAERRADGTVERYNGAGLFDARGAQRARYAKHHLLPMGESIPFQSVIPWFRKIDLGQAEWTPGAVPQPMSVELPGGEFRLSTLICFESAFGWLARDAVRRGSQCLVVITNDGWFGESAGPRQHAWLARLRAVESGVPLIRCANNGISFIVERNGEVLDRLDLGQRGIVRGTIQPGSGQTLYVRFGAWPLFWFLAGWLLVVGLALEGRR